MIEMNCSIAGVTGLTAAGDVSPNGTLTAHTHFGNMDWATIAPWQNLCLVLAAILAIGSYIWIHQLGQQKLPGPKSWPVVGSVPLVLKNWPRYYDFILDYFEEGHDVVDINLGLGFHILYIADPNLVEYLLKTNFKNYPKVGMHVCPIFLAE
jgi:hypothetical protein